MFIDRFLVLVAWQTHGLGLSWPAGTYHPTLIEWAVFAGLAAAAALIFLLLVKVCAVGTATSAGPPPAGRRLRSLATAACLVFGFAAAGVGLALSAGLASAPFLTRSCPAARWCSLQVFPDVAGAGGLRADSGRESPRTGHVTALP